MLKNIRYSTKFGGANGNFNALHVAVPEIDWIEFGDKFIESIGLCRNQYNFNTYIQNELLINVEQLIHTAAFGSKSMFKRGSRKRRGSKKKRGKRNSQRGKRNSTRNGNSRRSNNPKRSSRKRGKRGNK